MMKKNSSFPNIELRLDCTARFLRSIYLFSERTKCCCRRVGRRRRRCFLSLSLCLSLWIFFLSLSSRMWMMMHVWVQILLHQAATMRPIERRVKFNSRSLALSLVRERSNEFPTMMLVLLIDLNDCADKD